MTEYETLEYLFDGYINEDFDLDYGTAAGAVDAFAFHERRRAPLLRREADALLAEPRTDEELGLMLHEMGLSYLVHADGWNSYREWLLAVADRVDALLAAQVPQQRPA